MTNIKVMKLKTYSILPRYAHTYGDAGLDLYSSENYTLKPNEVVLVSTGIVMAIPEGYAGLIWDRSGLSTRHYIHKFAGVIDSSYRGDVLVALFNHGKNPYDIKRGDKIAQMLIQKIEHMQIEETDKLEETCRGDKGFGSTGN
ncbi:dUTP diphosphatase [Candidatus Woesearchaeota archaeon]|nr:dUTP diphosphatase [Candidatus Woesearchaeota archaeon]